MMKVLGKKSLSSKVTIGLVILFTLISIIDIWVLGMIMKVGIHIINGENIQNNVFDFTLFITIIITGIIALLIIYEFIKIFKNLQDNILFSLNNSKSLGIISNSCLVISVCYFVIAIFLFVITKNAMWEFIKYSLFFSIILMVIFVVSGIGIKILNEIYKKAIEYKEENDFTI